MDTKLIAKEKEFVIWQDECLKFEDWEADLAEEYPTLCREDLVNKMYERNSEHLADERSNLGDIVLTKPILAIADLGLWFGRRTGYKLITSGRVSDCLDCGENGSAAWFVDEKGNFRARMHHHDGSNYILYRGIKPNISQNQIDNLTDRIYAGKDFEAMLAQYTFRLGDLIGDVYGWSFPRRPKCTLGGRL